MKIILIGFMGSGKTSVAKLLSEQLNLPAYDMDQLVYEKTHSENMHEVFAKGGELLLRETEIELAKEYRSKKHFILSTGGGVVTNKIIVDYLKQNDGQVFFLQATFDTIAERLKHDDSRPLFKDLTQAKALYDFRLPLYQAYADHVIQVDDQTVDEVTDSIVGRIKRSESADIVGGFAALNPPYENE